jgi:AcrR family transcriptional regulator
VSPTPARTSREAIIGAACAILEEDGLAAVTMVTVARRVGVRPPSLYKHVRDRSALVAALVALAADELGAGLAEAGAASGRAPGPDPAAERVAAIADAYRDYARRSPRTASLLFTDLGPATGPMVAVSARAATPVVEAAAALVGPEGALPAARVLTAFVHGFTSMEMAGAFRLGGDVDEAFRLGVKTLVRGLRDERLGVAG